MYLFYINTDAAYCAPRWKAPESSFLKINADAAYCAETGKGATACVIRDQRGATVMAQAKWYDNLLDAAMGEALALPRCSRPS
jgi:hypothetical protein